MSDQSNLDFWQMQSDFDINGLIRALASDDKKIRQRAAVALRSLRVKDSLEPLREAHQREQDPETGLVLASAIESLSGEAPASTTKPDIHDEVTSKTSAVDRLIAIVRSNDGDAIIEAATTLGEMGEKIAVEALIIAFNNQKHSIQVRLAIAEALLKLESAPVEVALLANLRHPDWHIRRNGAAILGQLRAEWAIQPLARSLADPHPVVRRTSLAALKHIGTPESRKALARFSPANQQNPVTTKKNARKRVSGIEVKRPGKADDAEKSSLLKRLTEEEEAEANARQGTKPLDAEIVEQYENQPSKTITQQIDVDTMEALNQILSGNNEIDSSSEDDE